MQKRMVLVVGLLACAPREAQPQVFTTGTPAEVALAQSKALEHLARRAGQRGIRPGDLVVSSVTVDQLSMAHVRVQQSFRGVPVFGGEAIVHFRSNGELFAETDALLPDIVLVTTPRLTPAEAIARAVAEDRCADCLTPPPVADLWVLRRDGADHLAYRVRLSRVAGAQAALPVIFIDAHGGDVVWRYDNLQTGPTGPIAPDPERGVRPPG